MSGWAVSSYPTAFDYGRKIPQDGAWEPRTTGAALIRVQLSQGERRGSPADGSVARFRDTRLHLFPNEREARTFVDRYVQE